MTNDARWSFPSLSLAALGRSFSVELFPSLSLISIRVTCQRHTSIWSSLSASPSYSLGTIPSLATSTDFSARRVSSGSRVPRVWPCQNGPASSTLSNCLFARTSGTIHAFPKSLVGLNISIMLHFQFLSPCVLSTFFHVLSR